MVRYQCLESYNGTPSAICGYDGRYVTRGGCLRRCGELPRVPHGVPEGLEPPEGWLEGMTVPYACEARFEGHVSASCTPQGNYSVAGRGFLVGYISEEKGSKQTGFLMFSLGFLRFSFKFSIVFLCFP